MTGTGAARLDPAARAELIYRSARAGLEDRLWEAALGDSGETPAPAPMARGRSLLRLDALVEALAADDRFQPALSPDPPAPSGGALRLGANEPFRPALEAAAARTGLDPALLAAIVDAEAARLPSGAWDPASRNPRSSATGLGQFLTGTWLDEARRPGSWLNAVANARGWLTGGGGVRDEARPALLALRADPVAAINAVADHAAANLKRLRAAGVQTGDLPGTARAAYLAHHLGLGDALRFLGRGLDENRAGRLLAAQVGGTSAARRIAAAGSAVEAHRSWLDHYVARRIRPTAFRSA